MGNRPDPTDVLYWINYNIIISEVDYLAKRTSSKKPLSKGILKAYKEESEMKDNIKKRCVYCEKAQRDYLENPDLAIYYDFNGAKVMVVGCVTHVQKIFDSLDNRKGKKVVKEKILNKKKLLKCCQCGKEDLSIKMYFSSGYYCEKCMNEYEKSYESELHD
jgi:hypothetical protein